MRTDKKQGHSVEEEWRKEWKCQGEMGPAQKTEREGCGMQDIPQHPYHDSKPNEEALPSLARLHFIFLMI